MSRSTVARRVQQGILVGLAAAGAWTAAPAQDARALAVLDSASVRLAPRAGDVLSRAVTIRLTDVPLEAALHVLARKCGLRLSYSSEVVPVARRVSVSRDKAPVGDVLRELLQGTDIDVVVTPSGYVVLVRSPTSAALPDDGTTATAPSSTDGLAVARPALRAQVMDRVIVMGTPAAGAPERELPSAVTVLTSMQIAALGAATMEDLLRAGVPGIVAWDLGISGPFAQLGSIRGSSSFTANYLKTYVDGVELASPYLLFAIDPYSIERIEIIRGPQGSAIYGSDAISGVVHVVTRRGSAAARWRPQFDAMLSGGRVESRYMNEASGAQRHSGMAATGGGTSSFGLGGTWSSAGEIVPGSSGGYRGLYGGARHLVGFLRVEGTLRYADVRFSAPPNPLLLAQPELGSVRPVLEDQRIENETYGLMLDAQPVDGMRHTLVIGLDRHAGAIPPQREPATEANALLGATRERASKSSLRFSTAVRVFEGEAGGATVTLGSDRTETSRDRLASREVVAGTGTGLTALYHDDIINTGAFAQVKVDLARTVFLTAGLRADRNSTFGEHFGTAWSPMVGAAVTRDLGLTTVKVRAAYGKGIRPPPPSARQAITTVTYRQDANPLLEPESQSGVEGGFELFLGDRASVSVTGYSQNADGLIQQVYVNRLTTRAFQYQNVGRISNRGAELEGSVRGGALRLSGAYAITDSRVRALSLTYSGDLKVGDRVPEVPGSSGLAALSWQAGRAEATLGVAYVGAWTGYDWEQFVADEAVPITQRPQSYYLRDYPSIVKPYLSLSQTVTRDVTWFGRVDNLTNVQRNERDNLQITPGRTMTIGVRIGR